MRSFCEGGVRTVGRKIGHPQDFSGCYVLMEGGTAFYVGISRAVIARLIQHVRGRTHFDASLAYRMACRCRPHTMRRKAAMLDPEFGPASQREQERIAAMDVAVIEITDPVELYLFEVYCALELRTVMRNTFRTH